MSSSPHTTGAKRAFTLNTRHDKGKDLFFRLLEVSDVVLENFRPGTMAEMGFGYDKLCKVNPGIILASVSGFGQYGPYRDRQCFDPDYPGDERFRRSNRSGV